MTPNSVARAARLLACAAAAAALSDCGSSTPTGPSTDNPTITITATGVSPSQVTIHVGGRVTFLNNDVRIHAMSSDPIQTHTDCPAINDVGLLNPGQGRSTGAFETARTCGFHDHTNELDPTWHGQIVVQ
jgi:plastocyanin